MLFSYRIYTPFNETSSDTFTKSWNAIANSLILITVVILMTTLLIVLYKNRYYKVKNDLLCTFSIGADSPYNSFCLGDNWMAYSLHFHAHVFVRIFIFRVSNLDFIFV